MTSFQSISNHYMLGWYMLDNAGMLCHTNIIIYERNAYWHYRSRLLNPPSTVRHRPSRWSCVTLPHGGSSGRSVVFNSSFVVLSDESIFERSELDGTLVPLRRSRVVNIHFHSSTTRVHHGGSGSSVGSVSTLRRCCHPRDADSWGPLGIESVVMSLVGDTEDDDGEDNACELYGLLFTISVISCIAFV